MGGQPWLELELHGRPWGLAGEKGGGRGEGGAARVATGGVPWGGAAGTQGTHGCSVQFAREGLLSACCVVREEEEEEREKKKKRKEKKKEKKEKCGNFSKLENFGEKNKRQFIKVYA
jgi:hypothetical protein